MPSRRREEGFASPERNPAIQKGVVARCVRVASFSFDSGRVVSHYSFVYLGGHGSCAVDAPRHGLGGLRSKIVDLVHGRRVPGMTYLIG
jgi:hypothetical protein